MGLRYTGFAVHREFLLQDFDSNDGATLICNRTRRGIAMRPRAARALHRIRNGPLLRALLRSVEAIHRCRRVARRLHDFELGANPARQLTAEYRLGHEVAGPEAHPFRTRVEVVARGNHDYRNLRGQRTVSKFSHDLETVHVRHHQVEEDHVNFVFLNQFETLRARVGLYRDEAFTLQMPHENRDGVLIVVNDHYLRRPVCFVHTNPWLRYSSSPSSEDAVAITPQRRSLAENVVRLSPSNRAAACLFPPLCLSASLINLPSNSRTKLFRFTPASPSRIGIGGAAGRAPTARLSGRIGVSIVEFSRRSASRSTLAPTPRPFPDP